MEKDAILIIEEEPDPALQRLLRRVLTAYVLQFASGSERALQMVAQHAPDLILLNLSGAAQRADFALCMQLRRCGPVPIIVLSDQAAACQAVEALNAGADDYMRAPIDADELRARVRVRLRRPLLEDIWNDKLDPTLLRSQDGYLSLYVQQRQIFAGSHEVHLGKTEFALLYQLMYHADKVLTHRWLLHQVWGPEYAEATNSLRVYIHQLRSKVEQEPGCPRYIQTEQGVGYVFRSA